MPTKSSPSRKAFHFVELKATNDETGEFEGYLSVFGNVDSYKDVVDRGSFSKTIKEAKSKQEPFLFPILWQHNPHEPIGGFLEMSEDSRGLFVKGQLDLDIEPGKRAYSGMKKGYLRGLSIGYETVKDGWEKDIRHLKEIRLYEGSVVTFPANTAAQVDQVKSLKDGAGIDTLVSIVSNLDYYASQFDYYADALQAILGISDPDELLAPSTPSDPVAALDASAGLSSFAKKIDGLADQAAALVDQVRDGLGIPDYDDQYCYSSAEDPRERKEGRTLSTSNRNKMKDALDMIGNGHKSMSDLLESTEPDDEKSESTPVAEELPIEEKSEEDFEAFLSLANEMSQFIRRN